jgi:hypothetical protein
MEPKGSQPRSQEAVTFLCPELDESSPYPTTLVTGREDP